MQKNVFCFVCKKSALKIRTCKLQNSLAAKFKSTLAATPTLQQQNNISSNSNYNNSISHRSINQFQRTQSVLCESGFLRCPNLSKNSSKCFTSSDEQNKIKPFEEIPGPGGIYLFPVIGTLLHFKPFTRYTLRNFHEYQIELFAKYGPLVRLQLGNYAVIVEDPDDISVVYKSEGRYPKRPLFHLPLAFSRRNKLPTSIAVKQGEEWLNLRRALNQKMMKRDSALMYIKPQNKVADDLVKRIKEKSFSPEELRNEFFKYATESICTLAFDKRIGYLDDKLEPWKEESLKNMEILFDKFNEALYRPAGFYNFLRTPFYRKFEEAYLDIYKLTNSLLEQGIRELQEKEKLGQLDLKNPTFLQALLASESLSMDDIKSAIIDLFIGGTDSTAKNLQMLLHTLARNPDKQQRLYDDIVSHVGKSGPLTEKALNEMHYLKACVKEYFRLYPSVATIVRFPSKDIVLRGYRVPKDTLIMLCPHRTVKNEKYFPEAERFLPERWLREECGHRAESIHPMASLPFGFGPRSCVGRRFAEQEMYLAVTKFIQTFEICLEPGFEEVETHYVVFITTKKPIHFLFKPRQQQQQQSLTKSLPVVT